MSLQFTIASLFRRGAMALGYLRLTRLTIIWCRAAELCCPVFAPEFRTLRSHFTAESGDLEGAVALQEEVARTEPDVQGGAYALAGLLREKQGKSFEAVECYRRALAASPPIGEEARADLRDRIQRLSGKVM